MLTVQDTSSWAREVAKTLKGRDVLSDTRLEELLLRAPKRGAVSVGDLQSALSASDSETARNVALSAEERRNLQDYQWSSTPLVWNNYISARTLVSRLSRDGRSDVPTDAVEALQAALCGLVRQQDIQGLSATAALREELKTLNDLMIRCRAVPARLVWWEEWKAALFPSSPEGSLQAHRSREIVAINRQLREFCPKLKERLIAFGKEYRDRYVEDGIADTTAVSVEKGFLDRFTGIASSLRALVPDEKREAFDSLVLSFQDKIRLSKDGVVRLTDAELGLYKGLTAWQQYTSSLPVQGNVPAATREELEGQFIRRNLHCVVRLGLAPKPPPAYGASKLAKLVLHSTVDASPHTVIWLWRPNGEDTWTVVERTHWAVVEARRSNDWVTTTELLGELGEIFKSLPLDYLKL